MRSDFHSYTVEQLIQMDMLEPPMDGNHGSIHPKTSDYVSEGVPFIMANDLVDGTIDFSSCAHITERQASTLRKGFSHPGDILLTHKATIGRTAVVPDIYPTIILTPQVTYYRVKRGIYNRYLKYYFDSAPFQQILNNWAGSGSTRAYLGITAQRKLPIVLPPYDLQVKISSILRTLDDKIELNNRINENLATQIRTLCNGWFNDFAPFEGICPNDWELTSLSSFARFISGYAYKGSELQSSSVAMATIKNFDRKGGFKLDGYKEIIPSGKVKPEHHATLFDTLVAHTDLTQNAEVIGNAEPVLSLSGYEDIIFSMDVVKVIPSTPAISKFLIAAMLQTQQFKDHCLGYVNGTTVLHLSKKALPEYSLMLPKDFSTLKPLDDAVSVMYKQMTANIDENLTLTQLRDSLLPKLMSGELDVSEIDL